MANAPVMTVDSSLKTGPANRTPSGKWILNSWLDMLFFVSTPLLIVPLVLFLRSSWVGVEVDTISLIVSAFGGLGHHFPGMIRAYCDRELYQRFRLRFVLAPFFLLAVCIPLSLYHLNSMYLILSVWGCWHALMQVYGFVRIYDVKVGSISPVTAYWDWLMCLFWFSTAQVFSSGKMSRLLEYWYSSGGPLIPPMFVHAFRWVCLGLSIATLIGFLINHLVQTYRGCPPNSAKLLMLASGIGFWWFAMVFVDNIILGIALFETFHDVQYLAIVWLYNCRRANSNPDIGAFMKFLFRRGYSMMMLYVGLVFAYGMVGFFSQDLRSDTVKSILLGVIWASTILHFYFDGFIWKVREKSTRVSLGLAEGGNPSRVPQVARGEFVHLLKWSPLIVLLGWLSIAEFSGTRPLDNRSTTRTWPYSTQLQRLQNIAAAVPNDFRAQRRVATTLANLDHKDEAIAFLKAFLKRHPTNADGHQTLGEIYHVRGEIENAAACYQAALASARTKKERVIANHRLGEVYLLQKQFALAKLHFLEALKDDPQFEGSSSALRRLEQAIDAPP